MEWVNMSMNWKELKAVHLSLIKFQDQLKGHCVRVLSDSMTALACLRKEGSLASTALWDLSKDLLLFAQSRDISLYPVHLRGRLNVLADKASRNNLISTEWSLDRSSFERICQVWGVPQVDLFATRENSQLPLFVSPCPDPWALGCDALSDSLDWNQLRSIYLFPPFQLIEEVLWKLRSFVGSGFLVTPFWPTAHWFVPLERRCPSRIPLPREAFLFQRCSGITYYHKYPSLFRLHAWKL